MITLKSNGITNYFFNKFKKLLTVLRKEYRSIIQMMAFFQNKYIVLKCNHRIFRLYSIH